MDPIPISPVTINFILDYICPLDAPLPPHLISSPLLHRHRFLSLAIDNPVEYLAWPSHENERVIILLEALQKPPHDIPFAIQYSADPEYLQAHVRITSDAHSSPSELRLVFQWDPNLGWQYHNIALMPFPSHSFLEFSDALTIFKSPNDFLHEQSKIVSVIKNEDDEDSYWNGYGCSDDSDEMPNSAVKAHSQLNSEDAYWAQYSTVQGDSTLPSPLPIKRTLTSVDVDVSDADRVFVTSSNLQPTVTEMYNPLDPPSPHSLAQRLASLSERPDTPPLEDSPSSDSEPMSPHRHPRELNILVTVPNVSVSSIALVVDDEKNPDDLQSALQESIKGLYRLWKASQTGLPDTNKEHFLSLVQQAIEQ